MISFTSLISHQLHLDSFRRRGQFHQYIRLLSAKTKREKREQRFGQRTSNISGTKHEFSQLVKLFYKKSHPDLIRHSSPEYADVNNASFQQLNEVLSTIKSTNINNEYPPIMNKSISFYMRKDANEIISTPTSSSIAATAGTDTTNEFKQVILTLKTSGDYCRTALYQSFQSFFYQTKLLNEAQGERFIWGKDYSNDN